MCVWVHAYMHVEVRGCLSLSSSALYFGTGSLIEPGAHQLVKHSWSTRSRGFPDSFSLELGLQYVRHHSQMSMWVLRTDVQPSEAMLFEHRRTLLSVLAGSSSRYLHAYSLNTNRY